ncbi:hypothetical protein J4G48_0040050 [Bradyrhizobium barranii subsp. apii]|uniref:hypothetical protein n=1 Tax=Bradyrhizobium barranii TaxID=2992140 RepID=UPI001AA1CDBB|nr:hypothetical protein [Bradyrhizobium barranii]UPT95352.1 hypothetical protein J4G48_0040050 [Bradyrhizobium barranii subsp. apii]
MKIEGHVTEASDVGEKLRIIGQGQAITGFQDPGLRPWLNIMIEVPTTDRNRKAFYVGRHFSVNLKPE